MAFYDSTFLLNKGSKTGAIVRKIFAVIFTYLYMIPTQATDIEFPFDSSFNLDNYFSYMLLKIPTNQIQVDADLETLHVSGSHYFLNRDR